MADPAPHRDVDLGHTKPGKDVLHAKALAKCRLVLDHAPDVLAGKLVLERRELHTRYPIEMLIEARASGVISGHDEMPMFELSREDMYALLAYIDSFAPEGLRYVGP